MTVSRPIVAEMLGTMMLLTIVVGSGLMGEALSGGNQAIALLANSLATGAGLIVLIQMFAPHSGAHFNPAVTLAFLLRDEIQPRIAAGYVMAQLAGAVCGVWLAHLMFAQPILQASTKIRDGVGQGIAEAVATFGLVATILSMRKFKPEFTPVAVGLYITAAYWFTASTSFANPAVTLARSLTDSFAGIARSSLPLFIVGQLAGLFLAVMLFNWLLEEKPRHA